MPEPIRLTPGSIKQEQLQVYEEFSANIPGFIPTQINPLDRYRSPQVIFLKILMKILKVIITIELLLYIYRIFIQNF